MGRITQVIKHLVIINTLLFLLTEFKIIPSVNLTDLLALHFYESSKFHWWQYVTYMFMHGGFMHLLFNMYALWAFGSPLENMWGKNKFLFFYFSCGIGAALLHSGVNYYYFQKGMNTLIESGFSFETIKSLLAEGKYMPTWQETITKSTFDDMMSAYFVPSVGASGAIYGIMVAFAMLFPNAQMMMIFIPYPIKAKYFIPILVGIDLFSGITGFSLFGGNIAHFAHVGGALIGFIMMWYWRKNTPSNNPWDIR